MDTLPEAVLAAVLDYADLKTLVAVESVSHHLHGVLQAQGSWARLAHRNVVLIEDGGPASPMEWKQLMHAAARPSSVSTSTSLLQEVTDRDEESPDNTLTPSPCWQAIQSFPEWARSSDDIFTSLAMRVQYQCNCTHGIGCYWSSTPSPNPAAQDFIEYTVSSQSLVRTLQVVPYRAFWHPTEPAYAPRAVSFQIFSVVSGTSTKNELVHESPVFPVENKMQLNWFTLEQPVWLPNGGVMRLNMHGRHQAQTVPMDGPEGNIPYYYSCISYVSAQGQASLQLRL